MKEALRARPADPLSVRSHRLPDGGGGWPAWRREFRATVKLSLPLIGVYVAAIGINTTDIIMMGWLGTEALAAGSLGFNLVFPLYLLGLGVTLAVTPMTAQALGAGDEAGVRRTLRQGLWVGLCLGLPTVALLWQTEAILRALGQDPTLSAMAESYVRAILFGLVPIFWYTALRSFLTAHSQTRAILVATLLALPVNALCNYGLMFGNFGLPRLELLGAGIATLVVDFLLFGVVLGHVLRSPDFRHYALLTRLWRPDWPRFLEILRLGLPIGLGIIAEAFFFSAVIFLMGRIGVAEVAATAIVIQCMSVAFMVPLGISHAVMVRASLHAGAGRFADVVRTAWLGLAIAMAPLLAMAGVFLLGDETLVAFFLRADAEDATRVTGLAVGFMTTAALFQIFDGIGIVMVGLIRGLKATTLAMWFAFLSFWGFGVGSCLFLGLWLGFGAAGIWWGLGCGLAAGAVSSLLGVRICLRRLGRAA